MKRVIDLGWAAGFLEGEGSFAVAGTASPAISASQVQREPLERLERLFGGAIYHCSTNSTTNARPFWRWHLYGARAAGLMMTLFTLMSPKRREQIRNALQRWREAPGRRSFNRSKTHCPYDHEYTPANTYRDPRGRRSCRMCTKRIQREWMSRKRRAVDLAQE